MHDGLARQMDGSGRRTGSRGRSRIDRSIVPRGIGSSLGVVLGSLFLELADQQLDCSMSRSSFSDERPKRARRNTASCIFSFSMCSVFAWISASRAVISMSLRASSACRLAANARNASGSSGCGCGQPHDPNLGTSSLQGQVFWSGKQRRQTVTGLRGGSFVARQSRCRCALPRLKCSRGLTCCLI